MLYGKCKQILSGKGYAKVMNNLSYQEYFVVDKKCWSWLQYRKPNWMMSRSNIAQVVE